MMLNETYSEWDTIFRKCLTDLKEKYPKFNDGQIAKILGLPRATFNRMKNEEKTPKLDNMIKVLLGSGNIDLISNAVELIENGLGKKLRSALEVSLSEKEIISENKRLENIFEDRDVFTAYLVADKKNGSTKGEVLSILGDRGSNAINTLVEKDLAFIANDKIYIKKNGHLVRSFGSIKYHLNTYSRFYKPESIGTKRNYVHSLSEGLNSKGLLATQEAHKKLHREIQKIYRDDQYQGDIPAFSVAFCDTFSHNKDLISKEGLI